MTRISPDWLASAPARAVCAALEGGGHQAWFVGGCVRNALLGEEAADLDITTDARPERVTELVEAAGLRAVPTGIEHGTVTVVAGGRGFEVTTFRRDVETDGRRAVVAFSDSMGEDAARRGFSGFMRGMAAMGSTLKAWLLARHWPKAWKACRANALAMR